MHKFKSRMLVLVSQSMAIVISVMIMIMMTMHPTMTVTTVPKMILKGFMMMNIVIMSLMHLMLRLVVGHHKVRKCTTFYTQLP